MNNRGNVRVQKDPEERRVGRSGEDLVVKDGCDMSACFSVQLPGPLFNVAERSASVMSGEHVEEQCKALKQNIYLESTCIKVTYNDLCWKYFQLSRRRQTMH